MSEFADKIRTIGVIGRRSGDRVTEGRDAAGDRVKATTDEAGNTVVEHANSRDQVDVHIRAPHIHIGATEVRQHGN